MKKVNCLLLGLLSISAVAGLSSCEERLSDEELVASVKASLVFPNLTSGVKFDFEVYNEIDEVSITYESSNPEVLSFNDENTMCYVNAPEAGSSEILTSFTATFNYKDVTDTKLFKVRVLPSGHFTTVTELVQLADDGNSGPYEYSAYALKAVLIATTEKSSLFYDGTGYIYAYKVCTYDIGSYLFLDGSISLYGGIIELNSDTTFGTLYEEIPFEVPEFSPTEFTSDFSYNVWYTGNPSMATYCGSMVKITGTPKLTMYDDGVTVKYYNLDISNITQVTGSILYPSDEIGSVLEQAANDKKEVIVEGYSIYISGSSSKYLNIIATSVQLVESNN
ncbi:MAG: hypothetical protein ACI311_04620 [Bacilli bacterium]